MGALDILGGIPGLLSGAAEKGKEMLPGLKDIAEKAKDARGGFFGEVSKSLMLRQCPTLAAVTDIGAVLTGQKTEQKVPWQNIFETVTAVAMFVPDEWKHKVTDILANSSIFRTIVEYWPGLDGIDLGGIPMVGQYIPDAIGKGGNLRKRVLEDKDPTAVIGALRVIHQDFFVTGKVTYDKLKELLGGNGMAAGILALFGAGALAAGAKALEGGGVRGAGGTEGAGNGGKSSSESKTVEAVAAAATGTGALKGKKLLDLQKQNPAEQQTTMQKNLLAVIEALGVSESAVLVKGDWSGNNNECTVGFVYGNGVYFMTFDDDYTGSDISVRNANGATVYDKTDWNGIDADQDAKEIIEGINKNPSPDLNAGRGGAGGSGPGAGSAPAETPATSAPTEAPDHMTPDRPSLPSESPSNK